MVGHALVGHVIVAHRFYTFQQRDSRGACFGQQSEKKREHTAQDQCTGDDQERQVLAGLPSTFVSDAFEILHNAHLNRSYAHAKARTVHFCSDYEQESPSLQAGAVRESQSSSPRARS